MSHPSPLKAGLPPGVGSKAHKRILLIVLILSKWFTILGGRFVYAFLPLLAEVYDASYAQIAVTFSLMEFGGLSGPLAGWLVRRYGFERVSVSVILLSGLFTFITPMVQQYWWLFITRIVYGLCKALALTTFQTFLMYVPQSEVGKIAGTLELSFGMSTLVGIPLIGLIFALLSWQWVFYLLGALHVPTALALAYLTMYSEYDWYASMQILDKPLEADDKETAVELTEIAAQKPAESKDVVASAASEPHDSLWDTIQILFNIHPDLARKLSPDELLDSWCCFGVVFMCTLAMNIIYSNFPVWMTEVHNISQTRIAVLSFIFGVGEVLAEFVIINFSDRFGLARSIVFSMVGFCTMLLLLFVVTYFSSSLVLGLVLLVCTTFFFETAIVVLFARLPTVYTRSPELYVGVFAQLLTVGFALGALIAPYVWNLSKKGTFDTSGLLAGLAVAVGCLCAFLSQRAEQRLLALDQAEDSQLRKDLEELKLQVDAEEGENDAAATSDVVLRYKVSEA